MDTSDLGKEKDFIINGENPAEGKSDAKKTNTSQGPGGIDFRSLPIVTQAISNLHAGLSSISPRRLQNINLSFEWQEIDRLVNSGITPSTQRIKEFVQAAAVQDEANSDIVKVTSCIADIFRLEEERCEASDPVLKDILIVLESGRNSQELKEVLVDYKL